MNTLNEFELNRIKKFYAQELANRLQRSKSTRLAAAQPNTCYWQTPGGVAAAAAATATAALHREQNLAPELTGQLLVAPCSSAAAEPDGKGTNVVDLKRYQHALSSKQRGRKSRAQQHQHQHQHSCSPRFGRALYNFQAKNEGELSLKCGDLVELLDVLEGADWARVEDCQSGLQGLVPVSYLDRNVGCGVAKRDVGSSSSRSSSRLSQAELTPEIATTAASLAADQLLPMSKGEPIALIRKLSGHLYEASNTRLATGLVWSNDLEIIRQPGDGGTDSCQCNRGTGTQKAPSSRAYGDAQRRRSADRRQRAETLMATAEGIGGIDEDQSLASKDYISDELDYQEGERGHENDDEDDDDEEISRYLSQLQSICTDLGQSKRRQHRQLMTLDREEVPLLLDSSLAKRRRARSASAALDVLHQEQQQHLHHHQKDEHYLARDRHQYVHSKQQQQQRRRHYEHQFEATPGRHHQVCLSTTSTGNSEQYRGQKYCICCRQEDSDDLHHQRQPPRSSSSPHIVGATERLQQPQGADPNANAAPTVTNSNLPRLCRARFAYKPRQRDELELVVGDILVVVQECDDGWFIGSSYTTKQMGTFPGNFVESI